jgi:hypothetical protein
MAHYLGAVQPGCIDYYPDWVDEADQLFNCFGRRLRGNSTRSRCTGARAARRD